MSPSAAEAPRHEAADRVWWGGGRGGDEGLSRRYVSRRVHVAARRCRVRPPCVSEEVTDRAPDTPARYRNGQAAVARSRADRQGEGVMSRKGYETGSGNVFKDLGVPHAEEHLVKAQLVFKIDTLMKARRLTQWKRPHCSASVSRTCRRCCVASFGSSRLNGSCGSSWRSIRTSRS
jgi:hypothetical protein